MGVLCDKMVPFRVKGLLVFKGEKRIWIDRVTGPTYV